VTVQVDVDPLGVPLLNLQSCYRSSHTYPKTKIAVAIGCHSYR
jgi:hypothetical protein